MSKSSKAMRKVVKVPFRMVRYYTGSSATFNLARLQLRPDQMGSRLSAIKDQYNLYRFTSVKIVSLSPYAGTFVTSSDPRTVTHAVAWSQEYMSNVPTAFDTMSQLAMFDIADGFHTSTIQLNRDLLIGQEPLKWFRTDQDEPSGTAPSDFTDQGWLYWAMWNDYGFGGLRHHCYISGIVEFCSAKDPSLDVDRKVPSEVPIASLPTDAILVEQGDLPGDSVTPDMASTTGAPIARPAYAPSHPGSVVSAVRQRK